MGQTVLSDHAGSAKKGMGTKEIVIGTRGSALALWQADFVAGRLSQAFGVSTVTKTLKTRGDVMLDAPLAKLGGKGLFVKEIEEALLRGEIDIAVHSMKDVPTEIPEGLVIAAITAREDPRDAVVSREGKSLFDQPPGTRVGTSSLRRMCQLRARRPDFSVEPLRGNVDTRLRRLDEGRYDAIVVALAGLRRLGREHVVREVLSLDVMVPAIGQGALGIECRSDDERICAMVVSLNDPGTEVAVRCERAFLGHLGGGCQTPIAAHAQVSGGTVRILGLVGRPDGSEVVRGSAEGPASSPEATGIRLAEDLLCRGGRRILETTRAEAEAWTPKPRS